MTLAGPGTRERCRGGTMAAEGASHFLGIPSEAQTFPRWRVSRLPTPPRKESDGLLPQSEMRPPRRKAGPGSRVKGQGIPGWPPSEPGKLAPARTLPPPVSSGDFGFFQEMPWRMEMGGSEAKTKGQVQAGRRMSRNGGRAVVLLLAPSEPPCPHPSWRRASGASGRSFMGRSPPGRRGL